MKKLLKLLGVLLALVVLCLAGLVAGAEYLSHRAHRDLMATIEQLPPGTPFTTVRQRLGQPTQVFTNSEEIVAWVAQIGTQVDPSVATNSALHTFVHRGPPYRYILIYTDRESQRVLQAGWWFM